MKKKYTIPILGFFIISLLACIKKPEENTRESTEKSKKVISKTDFDDNENGFYYLGHLGKEQQSEGTLICWAVCVVNVAQGILGDRQLTTCDLIRKGGDDCHVDKNNRVRVHRSHNSRRDTCQIENEALKIGIKLNNFDRKHFKDFEYMKKFFNEEGVPIVVKLSHPEQSHLIYISGYGTFGGCNFYYVFDPLPGPEKFRTVEDFNSDLDRKFEKSWKPEPKETIGNVLPLKKSILVERIENIEKVLEDAYDKNKEDSIVNNLDLYNPLLYVSTNKIPLKVFKREIFDENEVFSNMEDCDDLAESSVGPSIIEIKKTIQERDKKIIAKRLLVGNHEYTTNNGKLEISIKSDNNDDFLYRLKLDDTILQKFTKYDQKKLSETLKEIQQ